MRLPISLPTRRCSTRRWSVTTKCVVGTLACFTSTPPSKRSSGTGVWSQRLSAYTKPRIQLARLLTVTHSFYCDIDYDVFWYMEEFNKTYGFTINLYDSPESI